LPHPPEENNELHETIKRSERRDRMAQSQKERTIGQNIALIGALGWLIVMPTVGGVFAGRWLDGQAGGGIFWTGSSIFVGASLGAWLAWQRMKKEEK